MAHVSICQRLAKFCPFRRRNSGRTLRLATDTRHFSPSRSWNGGRTLRLDKYTRNVHHTRRQASVTYTCETESRETSDSDGCRVYVPPGNDVRKWAKTRKRPFVEIKERTHYPIGQRHGNFRPCPFDIFY